MLRRHGSRHDIEVPLLSKSKTPLADRKEFFLAVEKLSELERRAIVEGRINSELAAIRALPMDERRSAFRSLCAHWHPDKCPENAAVATEVFQGLQAQKAAAGC